MAAADNADAAVIALIAEMAEAEPKRVTPGARLLHDLGIDGDDAVEFFDVLHERFGTDLTHLHERWDDHFGPEGLPLSASLLVIPPSVVGGLIFSKLDNVVGNVFAGVAAATMIALCIVAAIWIGRKLDLIGDVVPITVADVLQAVRAGAWPR